MNDGINWSIHLYYIITYRKKITQFIHFSSAPLFKIITFTLMSQIYTTTKTFTTRHFIHIVIFHFVVKSRAPLVNAIIFNKLFDFVLLQHDSKHTPQMDHSSLFVYQSGEQTDSNTRDFLFEWKLNMENVHWLKASICCFFFFLPKQAHTAFHNDFEAKENTKMLNEQKAPIRRGKAVNILFVRDWTFYNENLYGFFDVR